MAKTLDMTKNVASLCDEYPELVDILVGLGFKPLANPLMRKMAGSHMTIPQASAMRDIPMDQILFALADHGFAVSGLEQADTQEQPAASEEPEQHAHEPGHVFLARMGKTRLRPGGVDATKWLLAQAVITPDTKILEVACNMGTTLMQIAQQYGAHVTGLDLDEAALDHARHNIQAQHLEDQITLVQGSAFALPFPDESFDIVINEAMLTMLVGDQKDKALAEYARVLKPGGILLTQDVCVYPEDEETRSEITAGISRAINVHVEPLTVNQWKDKFQSHGFSTREKDGPMTLLDPAGMEHDEGKEQTQQILTHALQPENADFFERMYHFFSAHKDQLGYIAVASTREQ